MSETLMVRYLMESGWDLHVPSVGSPNLFTIRKHSEPSPGNHVTHIDGCPCSPDAVIDLIQQKLIVKHAEYSARGVDVVIYRRVKLRGSDIRRAPSHDAGAFARCSYCRRYSDNQRSLFRNDFPCDCGKSGGWSGSFEPPTYDSVWSEAK